MSRPLALFAAAALAFAFTRLLLAPLLQLFSGGGLVRASCRGGTVPTALGVLWPLALAVSGGWLLAVGVLPAARLAAGLAACGGLGVLGLLDDVLG
ncbi:MAG: hypothetical protein K6U79_09450, partial [Firmicutes bacterium]|nr:hypothetical protein [Bacillota bacterium]